MANLKERDLPHGLHQLLHFWQGEEVNPEVLEKICDGEISEEEEVTMFLKWCMESGNVKNLSEEEQKFLKTNGYSFATKTNERYQESLRQVAKELGKPVEQLTELEKDEALNRIGLSVLDLDVP